MGLISSDHNGLLIRRSIKILGHTYQNHGSHDAAFFPPLAKRRTGEGFYVNSGSAIPGHTLLLAHFPCMRYQTWDQGTWRLLPANIVQTLPAWEGLHGRLYLRNHKIHKMCEIQRYGTAIPTVQKFIGIDSLVQKLPFFVIIIKIWQDNCTGVTTHLNHSKRSLMKVTINR